MLIMVSSPILSNSKSSRSKRLAVRETQSYLPMLTLLLSLVQVTAELLAMRGARDLVYAPMPVNPQLSASGVGMMDGGRLTWGWNNTNGRAIFAS
ncbi:hypothetical protein [Dyella lipolytica]|uniref:Uncharacterized protein n=1 Tax=Dyella lipolytica TaxID=1867835 RepID=A0ABW8IVT0_9GAMM|nr:hypothetical protein [Dyella lipolytica]